MKSIDQLSDGETRIAVCEEVLGWTNLQWKTESSDEGTMHSWLRGRRPDGPHDYSEAPDPIHDANDTLAMIAKISENNEAKLIKYDDGDWSVRLCLGSDPVLSNTFGRAVCLAALAAVREFKS